MTPPDQVYKWWYQARRPHTWFMITTTHAWDEVRENLEALRVVAEELQDLIDKTKHEMTYSRALFKKIEDLGS